MPGKLRNITCANCGKQSTTRRRALFCSVSCAKWKGGKRIAYGNGQKSAGPYVMIYTGIRGRKAGKYTAEHVLIVERVIGRRLKKGEVVHHVNGDTLDNRNSNLLVCSDSYHKGLHSRMSYLYQKEHFK